jgi:fructoselysine/glucoselysine PTS system EIIA component
MRKFLIATHGNFASGIKSSLDIITGNTDNLSVIDAYTGENKSIESEINDVLEKIGNTDELIIFTDLMGGSVTNQIINFALRKNVYIISGFNLPLLLEIVLANPESPADEVIREGISNAKDQIIFVNTLIQSNNNLSND